MPELAPDVVETHLQPDRQAELTAAPEAAFAQQVAEVRNGGDLYDRTYKYRHTYVGHMALLGMVITATTSVENPISTVMGGGAAALSLIVGGQMIGKQEAKQQAALRNASPETLTHDLDMQYELFATQGKKGKRSVVLHWMGHNGNPDNATPLEQLRRVAHLAQGADVDSLLVPHEVITSIHGADREKFHIHDFSMWANRKKNLIHPKPKGGARVQYIAEASPETWSELASTMHMPHYEVTEHVRPKPQPTHIKWLKLNEMPAVNASIKQTKHAESVRTVTYLKEDRTPMEDIPTPVQKNDVRLRLRNTLANLALATAGLGVAVGQLALDKQHIAHEAQAEAELLREAGLPQGSTVDPEAMRNRVASMSTFGQVWGSWRELRRDFLTFDDPLGEATVTSISGGVGNAGTPSKNTAWNVTVINGPQETAAGHWITAVSSQAQGTVRDHMPVLDWKTPREITPDDYATKLRTTIEGMSLRSEIPDTILKVSATPQYIQYSGKGASVETPVLEGHSIVAANLDGKPVQLILRGNGTQHIWLPEKQASAGGTLTYWLAKHDRGQPFASKRANILADSSQGINVDRAKLKQTFEKHVPGAALMSSDALAEYLRSNLSYAYDPWPQQKLRDQRSIEGLVDLTFQEKKANCNVVAELMIAQNEELNMVLEYNNQTNPTALSNDEAHVRVVNKAGVMYDATPGIVQLTPENTRQPASWPLSTIAAGLAILGAGSIKRRYGQRVAKAVSAIRQSRDAKALSDPTTVREAVALTDHILWRDPAQTPSPAWKSGQAVNIHVSPDEAQSRLRQPQRHTKQVNHQLRKTPAVTRAHRRAIKAARRTAASL